MMFNETQLWQYLDGELPQEERVALEQALENDPALRAQYEQVLSLHRSLAEMTPEQPSMRFKMNVMDAINKLVAAQNAPLMSRKALRVMAGIFAGSLAILLVMALSLPSSTPMPVPYADKLSTATQNINQYLVFLQEPTVLLTLGIAMTGILLYFADGVLKRMMGGKG